MTPARHRFSFCHADGRLEAFDEAASLRSIFGEYEYVTALVEELAQALPRESVHFVATWAGNGVPALKRDETVLITVGDERTGSRGNTLRGACSADRIAKISTVAFLPASPSLVVSTFNRKRIAKCRFAAQTQDERDSIANPQPRRIHSHRICRPSRSRTSGIDIAKMGRELRWKRRQLSPPLWQEDSRMSQGSRAADHG